MQVRNTEIWSSDDAREIVPRFYVDILALEGYAYFKVRMRSKFSHRSLRISALYNFAHDIRHPTTYTLRSYVVGSVVVLIRVYREAKQT